MNEQQLQFILAEVWYLTMLASFQRVRIYADPSNPSNHLVRGYLRDELSALTPHYTAGPVSDARHIANVQHLADTLSSRCESLLFEKRFRIGVAQKALNLYLKYLWCIGQVPEPPHCPFDRTVIQELEGCQGISWSQFDDLDTYEQLVAAARRKASPLSLSEWELRFFNQP